MTCVCCQSAPPEFIVETRTGGKLEFMCGACKSLAVFVFGGRFTTMPSTKDKEY